MGGGFHIRLCSPCHKSLLLFIKCAFITVSGASMRKVSFFHPRCSMILVLHVEFEKVYSCEQLDGQTPIE